MNNATKTTLFVVVVMFTMMLVVHALSDQQCRRFGEETGLMVKHHFISGCYVKMDSGYWIPKSNVLYSPNSPEGMIENAD